MTRNILEQPQELVWAAAQNAELADPHRAAVKRAQFRELAQAIAGSALAVAVYAQRLVEASASVTRVSLRDLRQPASAGAPTAHPAPIIGSHVSHHQPCLRALQLNGPYSLRRQCRAYRPARWRDCIGLVTDQDDRGAKWGRLHLVNHRNA